MGGINSQNSILGLYVLNQSVTAEALISNDRGVYYSRLFQKPNNHIFYQLNWTDNQSSSTFEKIAIKIKLRTGDDLPYNYSTNQRYTFDECNVMIQTQAPDKIDGILYKWHLGRSLLGMTSSTNVNGNESTFEKGTAFNTTRLPGVLDPTWNYWSLPHLHQKSFISNNINHKYIQLRIELLNLDPSATILKPELYNITISSILQQGQ